MFRAARRVLSAELLRCGGCGMSRGQWLQAQVALACHIQCCCAQYLQDSTGYRLRQVPLRLF